MLIKLAFDYKDNVDKIAISIFKDEWGTEFQEKLQIFVGVCLNIFLHVGDQQAFPSVLGRAMRPPARQMLPDGLAM